MHSWISNWEDVDILPFCYTSRQHKYNTWTMICISIILCNILVLYFLPLPIFFRCSYYYCSSINTCCHANYLSCFCSNQFFVKTVVYLAMVHQVLLTVMVCCAYFAFMLHVLLTLAVCLSGVTWRERGKNNLQSDNFELCIIKSL